MSDALVKAAAAARVNAYAPYSRYAVGAAALDERGVIHAGCNVENASFGASMCAERVAVFKLVASGAKEVRALALVTEDGAVPCGMCLQVLREFTEHPEGLDVFCASAGGEVKTYTLAELLPHGFSFEKREGM